MGNCPVFLNLLLTVFMEKPVLSSSVNKFTVLAQSIIQGDPAGFLRTDSRPGGSTGFFGLHFGALDGSFLQGSSSFDFRSRG